VTGLDETADSSARLADQDLTLSDCMSQISPRGNKYYISYAQLGCECIVVRNEALKTIYTRMGSMVAIWNRLFIPVGQSQVHACRDAKQYRGLE
jgi:hypothetical protein